MEGRAGQKLLVESSRGEGHGGWRALSWIGAVWAGMGTGVDGLGRGRGRWWEGGGARGVVVEPYLQYLGAFVPAMWAKRGLRQ